MTLASPLTPAFLEALRIETAILQAKHPVMADVLSRAHAIVIEGRMFPEEDGHTASAWSSDGATAYYVNGTCGCNAATYREEPCKHRCAFRLYQRVSAAMAATPTVETRADIPAQFLTHLHGKVFVQYAGLLALAHARGLVSLSASFISVSDTLALAQATATFADGRSFTEAADATPNNVGRQIAPHFARMALTRSKARCLRDALNVAMCSLEELDSE